MGSHLNNESLQPSQPVQPIPTLNGILETSLYVDDLDRAAVFYRTLFGFTPIVTSDRLIALAVKPGQVLLLFRKRASRAIQLSHDGDGNLHVAFAIPESDLDHWRTRLLAYGVVIEGETTWERGGRSLYFRDPDGHLVELGSPGIWSNY
jgi:catechol 2,3-dioxygenase-like lactoylglutathione lyase family enzyme